MKEKLVEIFEKAEVSSVKSDLDYLIDYTIKLLTENNFQVKRYDKLKDKEIFEEVKGYQLPVVRVNGEIISAGNYDFRLLNDYCSGCTKGNCTNCIHTSRKNETI